MKLTAVQKSTETMAGKHIFIDTNVLVYAHNTFSPFCKMAQTKLQNAFNSYDSVWLNRQVLREFSVIYSRDMIDANGKVNYQELQTVVEQLERDYQIADDIAAITKGWLRLIKETNTGGKQIHDANIIATMQVNGIEDLLTNKVK